MGLYCSAGHFELASYFGVVTSLQKQFDDLLFARTQPNGLLSHQYPPFGLPFAPSKGARLDVAELDSIHNAILRQKKL
jgi:hypothetical protein